MYKEISEIGVYRNSFVNKSPLATDLGYPAFCCSPPFPCSGVRVGTDTGRKFFLHVS